jgi:hypothetical protein
MNIKHLILARLVLAILDGNATAVQMYQATLDACGPADF